MVSPDHLKHFSTNHCEYPDHYLIKDLTSLGKGKVNLNDLNHFYQDFAGYKYLKGKLVENFDKLLNIDLNLLIESQRKKLIIRLIDSKQN